MKLKSIILVSFLAAFFVSGPATALTAGADFSDIASWHENFNAVDYLKSQGIVEGYADGTYKPANSINRAEFLKIVMEGADYESEGSDCYPDVVEDWYAKYVCKATELGLVKGYDDGYFRPEQEINFAEASKIVANAMRLEQEETEGEWYKSYVDALEDYYAIPNTVVAFDEKLNRGEMAEMIWRIKERPERITYTTYKGIERKLTASEHAGELETPESCQDLMDYLAEKSDSYYGYYGEVEEAAVDFGAEPVAATSAATRDFSGVDDYSTTNVQVEGVDEADIVKNDGEYIYIVKGSTVRIVRAYPPDAMTELDALTFSDNNFYPNDLYVDGDRMVVLGYAYNNIYQDFPEEYSSDDYFYSGSVTKVYIFDIGDPANIEQVRQLSFEGSYSNSRKIDEMVYVVMSKHYSRYYYYEDWDEGDILPLYGDTAVGEVMPITDCGDIVYYPSGESTAYLVIAGIPIDDADGAVSEQVILGSSGTVYASRENLYVAEANSYWGWWSWDAYDSNEETVIHKFSLGDDITYVGEGSVPGTVLNQFSMDENGGYFRVATTLGNIFDSGNPSQNNLYVLNGNMERAGSVEGIAPGEKIYSVRFMGDRAYMVTFKKVDPFFVIDVAEPTNPRILGYLKIPGYSDYLHPYDENHIIGFGKEAVDAGEDLVAGRGLDFAWYQGLKVAMFDVTDVANPVEMHKVIIGDRGTESELLYNHKALLFNKNRGFMAFPVTLAEIPEEIKNDPQAPDNTYGEHTFKGAYIFDVSLDNGFELKGRVTHYDEGTDFSGEDFWYSGFGADIFRILYIGDYFYTVSRDVVKANAIVDLAESGTVDLEL